MHSLNPLNSGGLWLPVTITPPSAPNRKMEKYRRGVGQIPTSTTCIPADRIPSTRASRKEGEESRQSRPTMRDFPPSRAAYVPNPFPMETTVSGVRSSPTLPRMSYSRNIRGLTNLPPPVEVDSGYAREPRRATLVRCASLDTSPESNDKAQPVI